jgi:hypothetical protein
VAAKTAEARRVILKFWAHAVERTEEEIRELKAQGLFVRDATPEDKLAPHAEAEAQRAAAAAALAAATPPPPAASATPGPAAVVKPKD